MTPAKIREGNTCNSLVGDHKHAYLAGNEGDMDDREQPSGYVVRLPNILRTASRCYYCLGNCEEGQYMQITYELDYYEASAIARVGRRAFFAGRKTVRVSIPGV
jgi:hypothetical protein